jgi:anaerobic selenocysteine-containing dehydrogenase
MLTDMRVKTSCTRDCPDACGIIATVEEGRITKISGDPDHPVTRGHLCYRTNRFLERQYDPERLKAPLFRDGSIFKQVGWDIALNRIAEAMLRIRKESGAAAIMSYRCGGSLGLMKHVTEYFFERFGPVTVKSGDICSGAGEGAQAIDFGEADCNDLFDLLSSRTIVLWGKNPFVSSAHLIPLLKEAKAAGARLVQIDPVHHRAAELCDIYLQPRPGGDIALAAAVMRLLFERGEVDPAAADYCDNLEELKQSCFSRELEEYAKLADLAVAEIDRLAELYADGPSAILIGWGMQRRGRGAATVRMMDALAAISGNIGVPGGGAYFYFKRRGAFDLSFVGGAGAAPRTIPEPLLGRGILEAQDPAVRMVWIDSANPVAMLPDSETVARALGSRELTVVVDSFLTDTARCADIVLPATTMLEDEDLVGSYGHHWLGNVRPVVRHPEGVRTDYEIIQELSKLVAIGEDFACSASDWKRRLLGESATLEELEEGAVRNPLAAKVLFSDRRFATATGRINLIADVDPRPPLPTEERPMLLTAVSSRKTQASQSTSAMQNELLVVTVNPAAASGFEEGEEAYLESEIGKIRVRLAFDERQRTDVALTVKGGWLHRGRCANALLPAMLTDAGGGASYFDTPVRLLKLTE